MSRARLAALLAAGAVCAVVALPLAAAPALAHDAIVQTDPAADATVTALTHVTLAFTGDPVGGAGADLVQVKGPDGRYYETACPSLSGPNVTAPVALGPDGSYRVLWRIVSSDGHPASGSYSFRYRAAAAGTGAAGSAAPRCGAPAPARSADASASQAPTAGLWLGLGIGGAVTAAAAAGAWLLLRRPHGGRAARSE